MGSTSRGRSTGKRMLLVTMLVALNFALIAGLPIVSATSQSGRLLAETDSNTDTDETVRADPLDNLKKYRGGFDITNVHYWSSTAFTGVYGYAIAVVWLLCGVGYGGFLMITSLCKSRRKLKKKKKRMPCHNNGYLQPLLLALVLTILAILGIGLVLGGNAKFDSTAKRVIDIIIDIADEASDTIYNTTGAMREMSRMLEGLNENPEATSFLTSTSMGLEAQADDIARQASKNRRLVDTGLRIVYVITTVTISLTLVAVIALLVLGVLKFRRTIQVLIALCWTFTVLCWFFFGVYFFLQNFSEDTCTALESFQKDRYNNSLSSILPCDELLSTKTILTDVSAGIYDLVDEVNRNISTSYGNVFQICNPFSPPPLHEYQPWNCPASSIQIGDIPRVLRMLVCPDTGVGTTCNGGILVPAAEFDRVEAYTTSIQLLLDVYPGMDSLVECQTVDDAFSEILRKHCGPLKRYARMVWAALVFLSVVMVALVLVWAIGAHRDNSHPSFGGSVKPESAAADVMESGAAKASDGESKQSVDV